VAGVADSFSVQGVVKYEGEDKETSRADIMLIDSDDEIIEMDRQDKKIRHPSNESMAPQLRPQTSFCPSSQQLPETTLRFLSTRPANDTVTPPMRSLDDASDTRSKHATKRIHLDMSHQGASHVKTEPEYFPSAGVSFQNEGEWGEESGEGVYNEGDDLKDNGGLSSDLVQQPKWEPNDYGGTVVDYFNDSSIVSK